MNNLKRIIIVTFLGAQIVAFSHGQILSGEERRENLDTVHEILSIGVKPVEPDLLAPASSPFVPDLGNKAVIVVAKPAELTDEQLLAAVSGLIKPTGIFLFGGDFYLVFNERKLRVGNEFPVTYSGTEYNLIISEITGSTYKVRRGEAELQLKLK